MAEKVQIGIRLPVYGMFPVENPYDLIRDLVKTGERGGIDSVWVVDHYLMPDESIRAAGGDPHTNAPLEAWTTLTAVASWTGGVKVGTEVTPMIRHHPSILAKIVSTLDVLSRGRVILGAGAGWFPDEFRDFGLSWYKLSERFERMYEAVQVVQSLWTEESVNHDGKYFKLRDARLFPKPVQRPRPPVWFGGFSDRILRAVVKYGEGWIPANNTAPEQYEALFGRLKAFASDEERDPSTIVAAGPFTAQISRSFEEARRTIEEYGEKAAGHGASTSWNAAFSASRSYGIWGTPGECVKRMESYVRLGVQHFILDLQPPMTSLMSVELLCNEIIPHFKHR